jgi:hypothetical protein
MTRVWIAGILLLVPSLAASQATYTDAREVQLPATEVSPLHLMSPQKFVDAGLTKLSLSELRALAEWVRMHALMVGQLASGTAPPGLQARPAAAKAQPAIGEAQPAIREGQPATADMIETRILGDFTGWDGSTVFQLENGQIWQQSSFGSVHLFARSPRVTLVATPGGWRMEVEGVSQTVHVRRIR